MNIGKLLWYAACCNHWGLGWHSVSCAGWRDDRIAGSRSDLQLLFANGVHAAQPENNRPDHNRGDDRHELQ